MKTHPNKTATCDTRIFRCTSSTLRRTAKGSKQAFWQLDELGGTNCGRGFSPFPLGGIGYEATHVNDQPRLLVEMCRAGMTAGPGFKISTRVLESAAPRSHDKHLYGISAETSMQVQSKECILSLLVNNSRIFIRAPCQRSWDSGHGPQRGGGRQSKPKVERGNIRIKQF